MERSVQINLTVEEMADQLFNLDNQQVAQVFKLWKQKFDENYEQRKANNEPIWIFDLFHFLLYVAKELDEETKQVFTSFYTALIYNNIDKMVEKTKQNLSAFEFKS